jgi:hypothetical protein
MLRIFSPEKIRRLRPGANPRSWVPEASMLTSRPPKPLTCFYKCTATFRTHCIKLCTAIFVHILYICFIEFLWLFVRWINLLHLLSYRNETEGRKVVDILFGDKNTCVIGFTSPPLFLKKREIWRNKLVFCSVIKSVERENRVLNFF